MSNYSIPVTVHTHATVQAKDAIELAVSLIHKACDIQNGFYINLDGYLCFEYEVRSGSHPFWETNVIRLATETDRAAMLVIKQLQCYKP